MDKKIENHEYNIRQFIDVATRWDISVIYNTKSETRPFGMLTNHVTESRGFFEDFRNQLRIEIDKPENGKLSRKA